MLLQNWVNLLVWQSSKNARTCKGAFPETRLFTGKHSARKSTLCGNRAKSSMTSCQLAVLVAKVLSVSKWRVWHTAAARARGEIEEIESISRPGLLLILKCRLWWWKWLTVTLPPAFPLLPPSGKTESPTSHNKQSNPSFWGHQLWI